jgi:Arginase family
MTASPPFLGFPDRLAGGHVPCAVIFGAGHGSTYPGKDSSGYALAADAIRAASQADAALLEHWDFDLGGPLFDGKPVCCIDAGDIPTTMHDNAANRARIEAKTREVLAFSTVPILLGGETQAQPRNPNLSFLLAAKRNAPHPLPMKLRCRGAPATLRSREINNIRDMCGWHSVVRI